MSSNARTADAYRQCESLTRAAAANFYYGICLLPRDKRRAMCAVYAFARRVDDIGDGSLEPAEKLRRLDAAVQALGALSASGADPVIVALADAHERFALPLDALGELIQGVRMDIAGVSYERFDELLVYCRRVAGSIGRLCLAIFAPRNLSPVERADGDRLAEELGVAMQLTNILRDLREDAENGRVYLPAEDLVRYGLLAHRDGSSAPALVGDSPQLDALIRFQAKRADQCFQEGMSLVGLLDRRSAACVLAMTGIYRRLLDRIEAQPDLARRQRISLPMREKAWVATRSMLGAAT